MTGQNEVAAGPQPALVGQPAQVVELLVGQLLARPLGRRGMRCRNLVEPREGGGVVAISHRQVGIAGNHQRAALLEGADAVDRLPRARPVEGQVAGDDEPVGLVALGIGKRRLERGEGAVDVAQHGESKRHQPSTPARGMMNDRLASHATSSSTLATAWPRPKRPPSLSIVTSSVSLSPGWTTRLKRHSSIAANSPIRSPKPSCWAT